MLLELSYSDVQYQSHPDYFWRNLTEGNKTLEQY